MLGHKCTEGAVGTLQGGGEYRSREKMSRRLCRGSSVLVETLKFHCPEEERANGTVYRKTGGMKECVFRDQVGLRMSLRQ